MADARLSVEIAADLRQAIAAFSRAEQVVQGGARTMGAAITQVERRFTVLNANRFTFGANFQRSAAQAGQAATRTGVQFQGFSRVLQDAAFGPAAIANNLEGLGRDLAQLRATAASTGQSLGQTLIASLTGAGGLNLALGATTLAFSLASFGLGAWTRLFPSNEDALKKQASAVQAAKQALENYVASLDQVSQAQLKGAQDAQEDIVKLRTLYSITQNVSLSMKDRVEAVNELQRQYPAYFKNISDETILAGGASKAYKALTESILATAKARAAEGLIAENAKEQLLNLQKIADLEKAISNEQRAVDEKKRDYALRVNTDNATAAQKAIINAKLTGDLEERRAVFQDNINKLKNVNNRIDLKNLELTKSINKEIAKGADLIGGVGDEPKTPKSKEDKTGSLFFDTISIKDLGLKEKYAEILKQITDGNNAVKLGIEGAPLPNMNSYLDKLAEFQLAVHDILENGIVSAFQDLGTGIGEALNNGSNILAAAGQSFLGSIGSMMIQLGKLAIQTGIGIAAIKKALTSLNPVVAVAAGVALIALGTAVKGAASNIGTGGSGDISGSEAPTSRRQFQGFANGTNFAPGGMSWVGERGPELVNLPKGSQVIPTHKIGNMGGGNVINLNGRLAVSAGELLFMLDKERNRQSRQG